MIVPFEERLKGTVDLLILEEMIAKAELMIIDGYTTTNNTSEALRATLIIKHSTVTHRIESLKETQRAIINALNEKSVDKQKAVDNVVKLIKR